MSAFIVDDSTINKIIAYLYVKQTGNTHFYSARPLKEAGYDLQDRQDRERLGKDMFAVNVKSVNYRYGSGEAEKFRPLDYTYQDTMPTIAVAAYKALGCWIYQSCEGEADQDPLFKIMGKVYDRLAHEIVMGLDQYDKAEWG